MSRRVYNDLKQIIGEVVGSSTPTQALEGTIVNLEPLQVEIDGNSEFYPSSAFVVPEYLTDRTVNVDFNGSSGEMVVHNALKVDDKVLIIQSQQGQKLIILDRLAK